MSAGDITHYYAWLWTRLSAKATVRCVRTRPGLQFFRQIGLPVEEVALSSLLMVARLLKCPEASAGLPWSRSLGEGNSLCLGTGPFPLVLCEARSQAEQAARLRRSSGPCWTSESSSDWWNVCLY